MSYQPKNPNRLTIWIRRLVALNFLIGLAYVTWPYLRRVDWYTPLTDRPIIAYLRWWHLAIVALLTALAFLIYKKHPPGPPDQSQDTSA